MVALKKNLAIKFPEDEWWRLLQAQALLQACHPEIFSIFVLTPKFFQLEYRKEYLRREKYLKLNEHFPFQKKKNPTFSLFS